MKTQIQIYREVERQIAAGNELFLALVEACAELGSNILHALSCEGKVDNRLKGEK